MDQVPRAHAPIDGGGVAPGAIHGPQRRSPIVDIFRIGVPFHGGQHAEVVGRRPAVLMGIKSGSTRRKARRHVEPAFEPGIVAIDDNRIPRCARGLLLDVGRLDAYLVFIEAQQAQAAEADA